MADDAPKEKKQGGMMQLIIALVVVTLLGLGAGYGFGSFFAPPPPDAATAAAKPAAKDAAKKDAGHGEAAGHGAADAKKAEGGHGEAAPEGEQAAEEEEPEEEPVNIADLVSTPFPPVVTNIGNPQTVWVRLEGSVLSRKESETKPDLLAARAAQQILAYLRTLSLDELQGPNGMFHVNEDLNEIMMNFSNGDVRQVLINGLILE